MSLDLGQAMRDTVREVVREEIRSAMKDFAGGGVGPDAPLTYEQAAAFVGCHVHTIASWRKRGILQASGKGKMTRFTRADLLIALERQSAVVAVEETPEAFAERALNRKVRRIR
jgi:hypothetical protein